MPHSSPSLNWVNLFIHRCVSVGLWLKDIDRGNRSSSIRAIPGDHTRVPAQNYFTYLPATRSTWNSTMTILFLWLNTLMTIKAEMLLQNSFQNTLNHRCLTLSNPLSCFIYSINFLTFQPFEIRIHPMVQGILNSLKRGDTSEFQFLQVWVLVVGKYYFIILNYLHTTLIILAIHIC